MLLSLPQRFTGLIPLFLSVAFAADGTANDTAFYYSSPKISM